jgi:hypothetical protein
MWKKEHVTSSLNSDLIFLEPRNYLKTYILIIQETMQTNGTYLPRTRSLKDYKKLLQDLIKLGNRVNTTADDAQWGEDGGNI